MKNDSQSQLPTWVTRAAAIPLAFGIVREDSDLDLALVDRISGSALRVAMIASGGDSAACLAAHERISFLHLIDGNQAQLKLAAMKIDLVETCKPAHRAQVMAGAERGRYEALFSALQEELRPNHHPLRQLFGAQSLEDQQNYLRRQPELLVALREAIHEVMALPILVALFGEAATQNPQSSFAEHFTTVTLNALRSFHAANNPWLFRMLFSDFVESAGVGVHLPWHDLAMGPTKAKLQYSHASMHQALAADDAAYDMIHLSNILDWLTPAEANEVLATCFDKLRSGGAIIVRQLNSSLDIPACEPRLAWDAAFGRELLARDRSFFYRAILIARKA